MKDHKQPQLSKTEAALVSLQHRINLVDTGLIALMSILKIDPLDWYKALNDETALTVFNKNLGQSIQKYNSDQAKQNEQLSALQTE